MTTVIQGGSGLGGGDLEAIRQHRFQRADVDGDGNVTKEELSKVLPKNGKGPSVDEVFTKVDANRDGAIDAAEDAAARVEMAKTHGAGGAQGHRGHSQGPPPDPAELARELFTSVDADEDGSISLDELSSALAKNEKARGFDPKALFQMLDSDANGGVSQSELESTLQKMFDRRRAAEDHARMAGYDKSGSLAGESTISSGFTAIA